MLRIKNNPTKTYAQFQHDAFVPTLYNDSIQYFEKLGEFILGALWERSGGNFGGFGGINGYKGGTIHLVTSRKVRVKMK